MYKINFYQEYIQIPSILQEYILTVSGESSIMNIPIDDINGYLEGMEVFQSYGDHVEDHQSAPVFGQTSY